MTKATKRTFDDLCEEVKARPTPTSQAEWRHASTAMRQARRANVAKRGRTIWIECGSFARRIYLEATWGGMRCYNGPSPLGSVAMIGHHRLMYQQGVAGDRVQFARDFAKASRREGPISLP